MLRHVTWITVFYLLSISAYVQKSSSADSDSVQWTPAGKDIYLNEQTLTHISGTVHSLYLESVHKL